MPTPAHHIDAAFLSAYEEVLARWPVPVEAIEVNSTYGSTRVNACGPADGPPLILLHGGGSTAASWFANVAALARHHRVYAIDRIGEPGRSVRGDKPPRTVADLLNWLDGVLTALGVDGAAVCGHSYGGWIALTYALHAPTRVRQLVLLDPTQCFGRFSTRYLLRALPTLLRPTAPRVRAFLAWETGDVQPDPAWLQLYELAAQFPDQKVITGKRPDPKRLRTLTTPTLVLCAGRSRAHAPHRIAAEANRTLPHATVTTLPNLSHHTMPWHAATAINRQITNFLTKTTD